MADLQDGESVEMQGSGATPYVLKNVGGVYSCTCPAWRNQSTAIERRTCKHLRKLRGDAAEEARLGGALPQKPVRKAAGDDEEGGGEGPPLLLAQSWDSSSDLSGWWMSEKLDGVRAYWDGRQFLSRLGNLYHAPDWFLEGLPDVPLDGELWIDRKKFQRTVSIVRRQDKSDLWRDVRYLVFDAPACQGAFETRLEFLTETLARRPSKFAAMHEHQLCTGVEHLREELARVESLGGEGLMLREPGSLYQVGRSMSLLKVKNFRDAEAVVLAHQPGAGRHKGRLGALLVQMPDGTQLSVGTGFSDAERGAPPPVGAVITFRYQELSDAGVPRFPSYVGQRQDAPRPATAAKAEAKPSSARPSPTVLSPSKKSSTPAKTSAAPAPVAAGQGATAAARYFEFVGGTSAKFWEIKSSGTDVTVRFGRIGSQGQTKVKSFSDAAAATRHAEKLIAEKTKEGYCEK